MKLIKAAVIIVILVAIYRALGLDFLLDIAVDPAGHIPSVEIGK